MPIDGLVDLFPFGRRPACLPGSSRPRSYGELWSSSTESSIERLAQTTCVPDRQASADMSLQRLSQQTNRHPTGSMQRTETLTSIIAAFLERAMGFEPTTPTLARLCSTPELRPHPEARSRPPRAEAQDQSMLPRQAFTRPLQPNFAGNRAEQRTLHRSQTERKCSEAMSDDVNHGPQDANEQIAQLREQVQNLMKRPRCSCLVPGRRHRPAIRQSGPRHLRRPVRRPVRSRS